MTLLDALNLASIKPENLRLATTPQAALPDEGAVFPEFPGIRADTIAEVQGAVLARL